MIIMNYKINLGQWNKVFAVPCTVVDEHIKLAKDDFVKVLLVFLAHAGENLSQDTISNICSVSNETVCDALLFWSEKGIITIDNDTLLPADNKTDKAKEPIKVIEKIIPEKSKEINVNDKIKIKTKEPARLNSFEVAKLIETTSELKWLVSESEKMFGRFLTQTEVSVLVSMFDYAKIPADVIAMIIEYCISIDKTSFRFIEKTAYDWFDSGIDTHKKVEAHITLLQNQKNDEKIIKTAFGIYDRSLTKKEKEFISVWLHAYCYDEDMLKLAYEMCIDNTAKLSFPYINKVLSKWNESGIKTPADVQNSELQRKNNNSNADKTFDAKGFDDLSNYVVPDLSKKRSN